MVVTDKSWKWGYGPLILSDLLDGEDYDARHELAGWDKVGFDDSNGIPSRRAIRRPKLKRRSGHPFRKLEELPTKKSH